MAIKKGRVSTGATATPRQGSESSTNPNLSGRIVNGVSYDVAGKASEDPNLYYSEILDRFNHGDLSLEELYQYLANGVSGNKLSAEQREDFLKQMIDSMLAKRQLDEQRSYDNPLSQLQRLMAAGMSKDSALQALAGGAGSSGSGGSPLIGAAQSPAPSESFANEVQAKTSIANTALNALSCAANVASFGVSVPGQIANNTIMQVSATATKQAQLALEGVNAGVNALYACVNAGLISQDDADAASRTSRSLDSALQHCAKIDPNSAAAQFIASDQYSSLSSPYASRMAAERYQQQRAGDDYALTMAHNYRMYRGAELLSQLDIELTAEQITQEMLKNKDLILDGMIKSYNLDNVMPAQVEEILSNIANNYAQRQLALDEHRLFNVKKTNIIANTNLINANAFAARQQGEYSHQLSRQLDNTNTLFEQSLEARALDPFTGKRFSGRTWLLSGMVMDYAHNAMTLQAYTGLPYQKSFRKALVSSKEFQAVDALFKTTYYGGMHNYFENISPDFQKFIYGTQFIFGSPFGNSVATGDLIKDGLKLTTPNPLRLK